MTRLRKGLVLLAALLFAAALGIVVGAGPLQRSFEATWQRQVAAVAADPGDAAALRRARQQGARGARFDTRLAQALAPRLLDEQLAGRNVLVLAMPGVPEQVSDAVVDDLETAGAGVTGSLGVGRSLVDPAARPLVDVLSRRVLAELEESEDEETEDVGSGDPTYTRAGSLLARALLTRDNGGDDPDDVADRLYNVLSTGKLLHGEQPERRAGSAVVLLPEADRRQAGRSGRTQILAELVTALDQGSDGVVVSGHHSTATRHGLLAALRDRAPAAEIVSTVDSTAPAAHAVTVLALAEQLEGETGHYGVGVGAEAVLPPDPGVEEAEESGESGQSEE